MNIHSRRPTCQRATRRATPCGEIQDTRDVATWSAVPLLSREFGEFAYGGTCPRKTRVESGNLVRGEHEALREAARAKGFGRRPGRPMKDGTFGNIQKRVRGVAAGLPTFARLLVWGAHGGGRTEASDTRDDHSARAGKIHDTFSA